MKRILSVFLTACCLWMAAPATAQQNTDIYITDPRLQIRLPDVKGDTVSLVSQKGKVILLDFWASWCMPCRVSNRKLVKLYDKYKSKGFEIFGVSLDEDRRDWIKAIKFDKISWMQVVDDRGWKAQTGIDWNISSIPTSFLIDKQGRIVAMNLEGKELENAVKKLLDAP
jgi:peroxiredoxin